MVTDKSGKEDASDVIMVKMISLPRVILMVVNRLLIVTWKGDNIGHG